MTIKSIYKLSVLTLMTGVFLFSSSLLQADTLDMSSIEAGPMKADISKPYVVKKGDTLWDIADHFFKDPYHWLKVWERNLYITNPDLIYPGNKIWFDGKRLKKEGGLTLVQPKPQVLIKPVERLEVATDHSIMLTALERQDFIQPDQVQGIGHVLDSKDERLHFGVNDHVYLKMDKVAKAGELFDVFRSTDVIPVANSDKAAGVLVQHMGLIRIISEESGIHRGVVVKSFEEISRGDRLKPARSIDPRITPILSEKALSGGVIYIRNKANEAAQHQVIGINLGIDDGLKAGTAMSIHKKGRVVNNQVGGGSVLLPTEKVGELLVLVPQQKVSIAFITKSTSPIHIADTVKTVAAP